jgi:hypothetical protein
LPFMRSRTTGRGVAVIENMIRPAITRRTAKRGALLFVLLVVGGALLLSISSGPAEAVTTFTVNSTGDERSEWRQLRVLEEQDRHRRPVRSGPTT